jgi:putative addiction module component (TIGR02574 family)
MNSTTQKIVEKVSKLSPTDRAEIVELILESFDNKPDKSVMQAWAKEAEKRMESYKKGKIKTISEDDVFKSIDKWRKQ